MTVSRAVRSLGKSSVSGRRVGLKNRDRWPVEEWRRACETVIKMRADHWHVIAQCGECRLKMMVNLDIIIAMKGPRTSLWNAAPKCRRLGCAGVMAFWARPPGCSQHFELKGRKPPPV